MNIPLTKQSDLLDTAKESVWRSDAGPLENLFRLAENLGIIFGGGPIGLAAMAFEVFGIDLGKLGKMLDDKYGFHQISDLVNIDPDKLGEAAASEVPAEPQAQQASTPASSDEGFGSPFAAHSSIFIPMIKSAQDPIEEFTDPARSPFYGLEGTQTNVDPFMGQKVRKRWIEEQDEPSPLAKLREQQLRARQEKVLDVAQDPKLPPEEQGVQPQGYAPMREKPQRATPGRWFGDAARQYGTRPAKSVPQISSPEDAAQIEKQKNLRWEHEQKRMKAQEKLWRARESVSRKGWGGWGGRAKKATIAVGIGGLVSWIFKQLADPSSKISAALRAAGVLGAETIHQQFAGHSTQPELHKTAPTTRPTTKNPNKVKLERVVDKILGAQ